MWNRTITALLWALVGWGTVALGLRLWPEGAAAPAHTRSVADSVPEPGMLVRVLGSAPSSTTSPPLAPGNDMPWRLVGVAAAHRPVSRERQGVALLAREGEPVRSFRVGQRLDASWTVQAVEPRAVLLTATPAGPGAGTRRLELPTPAPAPAGVGALSQVLPPSVPSPSAHVEAAVPGGVLRGEGLRRAAQ